MLKKARNFRYAIVACWALFLGLLIAIGLPGVFGLEEMRQYEDDTDPEEETSTGIEFLSCSICLFSMLMPFIIPILLIVLIAYFAKYRMGAFRRNDNDGPRIISPVEYDHRSSMGIPQTRTIKHIHGDANKLLELVSERGTGIPKRCPSCRGPVTKFIDTDGYCEYCGIAIDYELIRNGIMKLIE